MRFKVKQLAERQGFDAAKLARRADLNYATVAPFFDPSQENKHNPKASTLIAVAEALGVEPGDLFVRGGEEDSEGRLRLPSTRAYA